MVVRPGRVRVPGAGWPTLGPGPVVGVGAKIPVVTDPSLFELVTDALRGLTSADLGVLQCTHHRCGIKVRLGPAKAPREHYEAQVIGRQYVPEASVLAIEIGFHSEHQKETDNEAVISRNGWRCGGTGSSPPAAIRFPTGLRPRSQHRGVIGPSMTAAASWC